jgi:uncharacterized protein YdcH (DUF465 family)
LQAEILPIENGLGFIFWAVIVAISAHNNVYSKLQHTIKEADEGYTNSRTISMKVLKHTLIHLKKYDRMYSTLQLFIPTPWEV